MALYRRQEAREGGCATGTAPQITESHVRPSQGHIRDRGVAPGNLEPLAALLQALRPRPRTPIHVVTDTVGGRRPRSSDLLPRTASPDTTGK